MKLSGAHYKNIFNESPIINAIITHYGMIIDLNKAFIKLSGMSKIDLVNQPYWELSCWVHSDEMQNRILFAIEEAAITKSVVRFEAKFKDASGKINDLDMHFRAIFDKNGDIQFFVASGFNVTALVKARRALSNHERQLSALFNHAKDGYVFNILPEGLQLPVQDRLLPVINDSIRYLKIAEINHSMKRILGIPTEMEVDESFMRFYTLLKLSGKQYRDCIFKVLSEGEYQFEHQITNANQEVKILEINLSIIKNESFYYGFFAVVRDLTLQKAYESELEYLANNDSLTGLKNRRYYFKKLGKLHQKSWTGYICMFDIDHFKRINDTYGHDTGDQVLMGFTKLAKEHFEPLSEVCRYGGEEFLTYIPIERETEADVFIEDFRQKSAALEFLSPEGQHFSITISIGVAKVTGNDDVDLIISKADKALYHSKGNGRNQVTFCREY